MPDGITHKKCGLNRGCLSVLSNAEFFWPKSIQNFRISQSDQRNFDYPQTQMPKIKKEQLCYKQMKTLEKSTLVRQNHMNNKLQL